MMRRLQVFGTIIFAVAAFGGIAIFTAIGLYMPGSDKLAPLGAAAIFTAAALGVILMLVSWRRG